MFKAINTEEQLLDFEQTPFLILSHMLSQIDPYDKLWHTVLEFHQCYEKWYYGKLLFIIRQLSTRIVMSIGGYYSHIVYFVSPEL